jgi:hypothetical protein
MFSHSITLTNGSVETRKSERRQYAACIVVSFTEESVRLHAEKKAKLEGQLVAERAKLADLKAKFGMTVEQAKAWHDEVQDKWFGPEREQLMDVYVGPGMCGNKLHAAVDAQMALKGFTKPFVQDSPYGIWDLATSVETLEDILAKWQPMTTGEKAVVSWHLTVNNATKALSNVECTNLVSKGHKLSIRTDFTVTEKGKKAV